MDFAEAPESGALREAVAQLAARMTTASAMQPAGRSALVSVLPAAGTVP